MATLGRQNGAWHILTHSSLTSVHSVPLPHSTCSQSQETHPDALSRCAQWRGLHNPALLKGVLRSRACSCLQWPAELLLLALELAVSCHPALPQPVAQHTHFLWHWLPCPRPSAAYLLRCSEQQHFSLNTVSLSGLASSHCPCQGDFPAMAPYQAPTTIHTLGTLPPD